MAEPDAQTRQRRGRRRQRWVLTALGFVFAVSAVLRIGTLDFAFAQDVTPPASPTQPTPVMTQTLQAALSEIDRLRGDLAAREAEVIDRETAVAAAQALVEARLAELEAAETRLAALIATSDSAAETDLDRLTRVYETMPAAEAAAIFGQMDPSFAAGFLTRMAPAASATLMAELPPEQAYAVSVVIATRNSSAPRLGATQEPASETEN
jgi:flagellar motility protein MotE (MotC chaperone)